MLLALGGIFAGALMALWLTRSIAGMLYTVNTFDPISLLLAALSLFIAALFGSLLPARAAAHVDPTSAIQQG
jgi:ABC-type antimicrobial peptide transport system permease subunit